MGNYDLSLGFHHSQPWRWKFPRLAFDLSTLPVLPFEYPVLPLLLAPNFNRPGSDSNLLEYHPEASRGHNATTACVQEEGVPLRVTPEGPRSFPDSQRLVRELRYCQHTCFARVPL